MAVIIPEKVKALAEDELTKHYKEDIINCIKNRYDVAELFNYFGEKFRFGNGTHEAATKIQA